MSHRSSTLRCWICLFAICTGVASPARVIASEPLTIRVLCYNIHHGEGVDGKLDLSRIARVIRATNPTIVALQEVDRKTQRTERVDQPAELARLTDMQVVFKKNIEFGGGEYGNAVLTKLPIVAHRNVHLPSFGNGEQRGALFLDINLGADNGKLLFICTHLDHRRDASERVASAKRLNELVMPYGDAPAILAGDMNATRDSEVIATLLKRWNHVSTQEQPTIPVTTPKRQIDFIMIRPQSRWRVVESRVLDEDLASDHRAIFAVLELTRE